MNTETAKEKETTNIYFWKKKMRNIKGCPKILVKRKLRK
jgi:hypothetical protein